MEVLEVEVIKQTATALTSLTTTGMMIFAATVIIFALAKFGVFGKILDREFKKRKISTGVDENIIKDILKNIDTIISNDRQQNDRLISIEKTQVEITDRMGNIEKSQFEYRMEAYKKAAFDDRLLYIDRMSPAIKFLLNGGNSETKNYFLEVLAYEDLDTWNGLCKTLGAIQYLRPARPKKPGRRSATTKK